MDVTDAGLGIDRRVGGTGEVVLADQGERHHTPAGRGRGDGRVGHIVVLQGEGAGLGELGNGRVHDEPRDPGPALTADGDLRVERTPQLAVGVPRLLHPAVVGVQLGDHLGEGVRDTEENRGRTRRDVEALSLWEVDRLCSRTGLTDFGGTPYCATVSVVCVMVRFGAGVATDEVLANFHTSRLVLELLPLASSAASEDMKNSVPPLADDAWPGGDVLGHTVKPGLPPAPRPVVSIWVTATLAAPDASAAFEKA